MQQIPSTLASLEESQQILSQIALQQEREEIGKCVDASIESHISHAEFYAKPHILIFIIAFPRGQFCERSSGSIACFHLNGDKRIGVTNKEINLQRIFLLLIVL